VSGDRAIRIAAAVVVVAVARFAAVVSYTQV
jgi:predicted small integral membrane protein